MASAGEGKAGQHPKGKEIVIGGMPVGKAWVEGYVAKID